MKFSAFGHLSTLKLGMQEGNSPPSKWALNLHFFRWIFWVENQSFWLCGSYLTVHLCHPPLSKTLPSSLGFQTLNPRERYDWTPPKKQLPKRWKFVLSRFLEDYRAYLEDHPRTCKWLRTMIDKSPNLGYFLPNGLNGLLSQKTNMALCRCYFLEGGVFVFHGL